MTLPTLSRLRADGLVSALDEHLARAIGRAGGESRPEVLLAAALLSARVGEGHVCLELRQLGTLLGEGGSHLELLASTDEWVTILRDSPVVSDGRHAATTPTPLVLDADGRLYLRRYWQYQEGLAAALRVRVNARSDRPGVDATWLRPELDRLFAGGAGGPSPDWQRVAVAAALERQLCVIAGGPGTGKTAIVVKLLALAIQHARHTGAPMPRMTLVAPTGKAAARLVESIRRAKADLAAPVGVDVIAAIPEEASTIHRCLGYGHRQFRHDADHPLATDILLVDEASMVDVALMARLVAALPRSAKLILLGDKDQLASVDAGAVFGDICDTGRSHPFSRAWAERLGALSGERIAVAAESDSAPAGPGIWDCVITLHHSYRYSADSGIGALAAAVNAGDGDAVLDLLRSTDHPDLELIEPGEEGRRSDRRRLDELLAQRAVEGFRPSLAVDAAPGDRLRAFERFRVLCAVRRGPRGVAALNHRIEATLAAAGLIDPTDASYVGRPVMVTRNDYDLQLFNGDVGMLLRHPDTDTDAGPAPLRATFAAADGVRSISPARLPSHETVFAMTVHKSQGSELDELLLVLPERDAPVLTRELLYTAVTRARDRVTVYGDPAVIYAAVARRTERPSGLRAALWCGFDDGNQKP